MLKNFSKEIYFSTKQTRKDASLSIIDEEETRMMKETAAK